MSVIVRKFLDEPVLVIGLASAVAAAAAAEGVISGPVAVIAVAALSFLQRHLVEPYYEA